MLIREHHLDTLGHVNNATYLELFEEARWDFLNENGFGLDLIHKLNLGPIVLEFNIKFLKELRLRELIVIESQMISYEKKIGVMRQTIFNHQGDISCQAQMTFGFFDLIARKLILPTEEWLKTIGVIV